MAQAFVLMGWLVASLAASTAPASETEVYNGNGAITYSYQLEPAGTGLRRLEMETAGGPLELRILHSAALLQIRVRVRAEEHVLTIGPKDVKVNGEPSCETLLAQSEALARIAAERASVAAPPEHLTQAYAALYLSTKRAVAASACDEFDLPSVRSGNCSAEHDDYDTCSKCCETDSGVAGMSCRLAGAMLCRVLGCRILLSGLCQKVTLQATDACVDTNCTGKSGDPTCAQPPPPCPAECKFKCGLAQRSICGDCNDLNPDFVCCGG